MNKIKNLVRIDIESEGEINGFFTIYLKDGTIRNGWSCDQGSIEMDDEGTISQEINNFLMDLWFEMNIDLDYEGRHFSHWTPREGLSPTTQEEV